MYTEDMRNKARAKKLARINLAADLIRRVLPEAGDRFKHKRDVFNDAEHLAYAEDHGKEFRKGLAAYVAARWPDVKDELARRKVRVEVSTSRTAAGIRRANGTGTIETVQFEREVMKGSLEHHNTRIELAPPSLNLIPLSKALREIAGLLEEAQR
jgi:hypothetical protein